MLAPRLPTKCRSGRPPQSGSHRVRFTAADKSKIMVGLSTHPKRGITPTNGLQGYSHFARNATLCIQQPIGGATADFKPSCKLRDAPTFGLQAVSESRSRMCRICGSHPLIPNDSLQDLFPQLQSSQTGMSGVNWRIPARSKCLVDYRTTDAAAGPIDPYRQGFQRPPGRLTDD